MPGCSVFDCNAGYRYSIRLHKFPKENSPLWKKWLRQLNRKDFYPGNGKGLYGAHQPGCNSAIGKKIWIE